ncbi:signal peptidase I [Aurantivibrio plasticivorans]
MDINFPLILVIAVFVTGGVWLFDWLVLSKQRKAAVKEVENQFQREGISRGDDDEHYLIAREAAEQEPVLVEYSKSFFPILALVLVLRSFVIEPFQIPSESMVPTLEVGDFILVNKFTYGLRLPVARTKVVNISDPKRGDVMVFFPPHESRYFIKRVIGLPGDTITYNNHELTINGEVIEQTFVKSEGATSSREHCARANSNYHLMEETLGETTHILRKCVVPGSLSRKGTYVVPEGHYFMMGDNRDNSSDSRDWGVVPEERIVGKAFAIWMHWENRLSLPSFDRVGGID